MPSAFDALLETMGARLDALPTDMPAIVSNPQTCPEPLLKHLALSRGVRRFDSNWPENVRRQVIKDTPALLVTAGTRASIEKALSAFATTVLIEEWWEQSPPGDPGTATATVLIGSDLGTDEQAQATIAQIISDWSRASLHWTIIVGVAGADSIAVAAGARATVLAQFSGVQSGA